MNLLFREKKSGKEKAKENPSISVQTREKEKYGINANYTENSLYRTIRENIPLIDVCILKIRRLVGSFEVQCDDETTERLLNEFLAGVKVGLSGRGINDFIGNYLEQMLTYGSAIGEIIVKGREIAALYNAPLDLVTVKEEKPLELSYFVRKGFEEVKCPYPELILFSALNPEPGEIYGVSLLRGLPFISEILMKIYKTIGINWERVGNVRFAVSLKDDGSAFSAERVKSVAEEWQKAMRSSEVNDFISLGEITVKAIGSDVSIPESQIPVRQMLEQIVAKMGLPPFLLGLSWSSTERMSSQQADILTSEIESYRMMLSPIIDKIIKLWMRLEGRKSTYKLVWNDITMQDEVDHAKARLMNAQADEIERKIEN